MSRQGRRKDTLSSLWSIPANDGPYRQNLAIMRTKKKAQMKAIVYHDCGSPDDALELQGIDNLKAKDKEVPA
jgi:hypothetical protein